MVEKQRRRRETNAAVWAAVSGMTFGEAWLRRDEPEIAALVTRYRDALAQLGAACQRERDATAARSDVCDGRPVAQARIQLDEPFRSDRGIQRSASR